jgi:diguanylate cyclase (GGDEF)-like protein
MKPQNVSLRVSLWLPIMLMGLVTIALVMITATRYQDLTLANRRTANAHLIQLKTNEILVTSSNHAHQIAADIQRKVKRLKAQGNFKATTLTHILNQQFHRYFQTAGVIRLRKLYQLNLSYQIVAESTDQSGITDNQGLLCKPFVKRASLRTGADRLKLVSGLCTHAGEPLYANVIPIGSLRPTGYMYVILDPMQCLAGLHKEMGMPLNISALPSGNTYKSPDWPQTNHMQHTMISTYQLTDQNNKPLIQISLLSNIQRLEQNLKTSRNLVTWLALLVTVIVMTATLLILQRTTLRPLCRLIQTIRVVENDRSRLGETVNTGGHAEIRELGEAYNRMTIELAGLYTGLEKLAYSDTLTGLPNRFLFNESVEQLIARCECNNHEIALLMMDLDRFKQINDSLGHAAGDTLLKQVARRLNESFRARDIVIRVNEMHARLGGDEFAAIVEVKNGSNDALVIAKRIQNEIKKSFAIDDHNLYVGISIGVAMFPSDGKNLTELMRHADVAMYNAKQNQRGIAFYNSMQDSQSLTILNLEVDLRHAIDHNMLEVYYQPKVVVDSGVVCGAEALLRWHHHEHGWVSPQMFVSIAEQTGLIENLTMWVLESAIADCAQWRARGHMLGVAINLSAKNLRNNELPQIIASLLARYDVPPSALTLEVTENAVMADTGRAQEILLALHKSGVVISLDDFGTGHSSLSHLKQLPVAEFKIDKSFVLDMLTDKGDATIVRATIELGHNLGLQVVAEGVENAAVHQQLQHLHCDYCQGFYFAKPMPMDAWLAFLNSGRDLDAASLQQV